MRLRAPRHEEAEIALRLAVAADLADIGEADTTLADIRDEWARIELDEDAVLAERDGAVVGYGVMRDEGRKAELSTADAEAEVALLDWAERRSRAHGHERHQQAVIEEAAFATVADYYPESFERFRAEHLEPHDFDPGLTRVADHGCALVRRWEGGEAHIDLLAVEPGHMGAGLGTALLHAAFRAAADAGLRTVSLGVASDNPRAFGLYTRAGMTEHWRVDAYEKPVPH